MIKHFYSFLVEHETVELELNNLDISKKEKEHLVAIVESSMHITVVDTVLSELSEKDKKIFLQNLKSKNHDNVWKHLHEKTEKIEKKIVKAIGELTKELRKNLVDVRKLQEK